MKSSLSEKQLEVLKEVLEKQSERWFMEGRSLCLQLGARDPKLCAMTLNPVALDSKFETEFERHRTEYINFYCKVMCKFSVAREYLKKFSGGDEFVELLLNLDQKITAFRRDSVYPQYPEMREVESTFVRNDFLFEEKSQRLFQTEHNLVTVSCSHFYDQFLVFLRKMMFELNLKGDFTSKEDVMDS